MTFEQWLDEVGEAVYRKAGVSREDLGDYPYRDAYDAGENPRDVAREVLEEAGFPEEYDDGDAADDDFPMSLEYDEGE